MCRRFHNRAAARRGFRRHQCLGCQSLADDEQILAAAYQEGRVLITADKDFGELVVRFARPTRGVVNLALGDLAAATRARIATTRLTELGDRILDSVVTIEPGRVRIRPLPPSGGQPSRK